MDENDPIHCDQLNALMAREKKPKFKRRTSFSSGCRKKTHATRPATCSDDSLTRGTPSTHDSTRIDVSRIVTPSSHGESFMSSGMIESSSVSH